MYAWRKQQVINLKLINSNLQKNLRVRRRKSRRQIYQSQHTFRYHWMHSASGWKWDWFASATGCCHLIRPLTQGARLSQSTAICVATDFQSRSTTVSVSYSMPQLKQRKNQQIDRKKANIYFELATNCCYQIQFICFRDSREQFRFLFCCILFPLASIQQFAFLVLSEPASEKRSRKADK